MCRNCSKRLQGSAEAKPRRKDKWIKKGGEKSIREVVHSLLLQSEPSWIRELRHKGIDVHQHSNGGLTIEGELPQASKQASNLSWSIMSAVSPQRSPAKSKRSRLSLSVVVALAILLLVLLSVDAVTPDDGGLKADVKLFSNDTLHSPDKTKTLRVTELGNVVISNETHVVWKSDWQPASQNDNFYLELNNQGQLHVHWFNGTIFYQWTQKPTLGTPRLYLRNTGILYMYGVELTRSLETRELLRWTNVCDTVLEPTFNSTLGVLLDFGDECVFSLDENSFMKLHQDGRLVTYTGYTPQYTFGQQDGQVKFLTLSNINVCELWIMVDREGFLGYLRMYLSDVQTILMPVLSQPYDWVVDLAATLVQLFWLDFSKNSHLIRHQAAIRSWTDDLVHLMNRLPEFQDKALLVSILKHARGMFEVYPPLDHYAIFKGTDTISNCTLSVTNDAKISIRTYSGNELWTNFPNN
ncbi:MAG: hypothetical protein J3Q66DRAFT_422291 [Benniella sp.]|nr:MAG: hypothetical protein J3Q66DRAFT_422291 [Benniella sp.]